MSDQEAQRIRLTPRWRWLLQHPLRSARAFLPRITPLRLRSAAVRVMRGSRPGPRQAWGDPATWLADLPRHAAASRSRPSGPLVSVHVIAYRNAVLTRLCVESVLRLTDYPDFEVVVVDNASGDGTTEALGEIADPRLRVLTRATNAGFAIAVNEAVASTRGEVVCILNNDVVVTRRWLSDLVDQLRLDPRIGLVGPVTNACANEARVPAGYTTLDEMLATAETRRQRHAGSAFEIPMLAFYCVAMRREVWNEIGELDRRFETGMFEDDDFCRRLRRHGYSIACREDVFVHHWGAAAFRQIDTRRYFEIWSRNRQLFRDKWRG